MGGTGRGVAFDEFVELFDVLREQARLRGQARLEGRDGRGLDLAALQREMDRAEERWNLRKEEEDAAAAEAKEAKE